MAAKYSGIDARELRKDEHLLSMTLACQEADAKAMEAKM
jgi:hypothetical protein